MSANFPLPESEMLAGVGESGRQSPWQSFSPGIHAMCPMALAMAGAAALLRPPLEGPL